MIRNLAVLSIFAFSTVSFLTSEQSVVQNISHAPGTYTISEVTVTVDEGLENSAHLQNLLQTAAQNSVHVFNKAAFGEKSLPLKIHLSGLNFRNPDATLMSDEGTYIEYTAILGGADSDSEQISIPVSQKHVAPMRIFNANVKEDMTRSMIRTSLKKTLGKLYGMETLPESVQTHFNTQNIFALREVSERRF